MKIGKSKRLLAFLLCMCVGSSLCGCSIIDEQWEVVEQYRKETATTEEKTKEEVTTTEALPEQNVLADFMNYDADTLGERIAVPNGYKRVGETSTVTTTTELATTTAVVGTTQQSGTDSAATTTQEATTQERRNDSGNSYSIEEFMRSLPVKKQDDKVMLYNGEEKKEQDSFAVIVNLALDSKNLQQRASSVMRLYAEYYWMNQKYDNMKYHLNNGFEMDYGKWIEGYRITVQNNTATWYNYGSAGDNYDTLLAYLEYYFCYSGMSSMLAESHEANPEQICVGDYFTDEKKENAAMVIDVAENEKGERCFLLAAGGSPGQDIEILKNPAHEDPWYYVSELKDTFSTPEFDLQKASCYHLTTLDSPATASGDASGNGTAAKSSSENE